MFIHVCHCRCMFALIRFRLVIKYLWSLQSYFVKILHFQFFTNPAINSKRSSKKPFIKKSDYVSIFRNFLQIFGDHSFSANKDSIKQETKLISINYFKIHIWHSTSPVKIFWIENVISIFSPIGSAARGLLLGWQPISKTAPNRMAKFS